MKAKMLVERGHIKNGWQHIEFRCTGCRHVTFTMTREDTADVILQMDANQAHDPRQHDPDRAPDIEVDFELVADCSICEDGGTIELIDAAESLECSDCKTTWSIDLDHSTTATDGQRAEPNQ